MSKNEGDRLVGESAIEYLRRVVDCCNHETEDILGYLPTVDAVLEYFALWRDYGTEFWDGILEGIAEGDDPAKARAFIAKHKLPACWSQDVNEAAAHGAGKRGARG